MVTEYKFGHIMNFKHIGTGVLFIVILRDHHFFTQITAHLCKRIGGC